MILELWILFIVYLLFTVWYMTVYHSLTSNGVLYGRQVSFSEVRDGCLKVRQHVTLLDDGSRLLTVVEPFTGYGLLLS